MTAKEFKVSFFIHKKDSPIIRENIWKQAQMDTIQFMKTMTLEVLVHDMQEEDMFINSADLICHISIQVYLFIMLHFIVLHRYCFFVVIGGGGVVFTN